VIVENMQDAILRLTVALKGDSREEVTYAANVLHHLRPAAAGLRISIGIIEEALATERRESRVDAFRKGWEARGAELGDAEPGDGRRLRAV
jgi:hypothetical protein